MPEFPIGLDRRPRIVITMECTRTCPRCAVGQVRAKDAFVQLDTKQWIDRINELVAKGYCEPIIVGLEPTLRPDLAEITRAFPWRTMVYTNWDRELDPKDWDKDKVFFVATMHTPSTMEERIAWVHRAIKFHRAGICVHPETLGVSEEAVRVIESATGLKLYPKEYQASPPPPEGPVLCRFPTPFIAPDGRRFFCNSKLFLGDQTAAIDDLAPVVRLCQNPTCNTCDHDRRGTVLQPNKEYVECSKSN